jgi:hypothetical protein
VCHQIERPSTVGSSSCNSEQKFLRVLNSANPKILSQIERIQNGTLGVRSLDLKQNKTINLHNLHAVQTQKRTNLGFWDLCIQMGGGGHWISSLKPDGWMDLHAIKQPKTHFRVLYLPPNYMDYGKGKQLVGKTSSKDFYIWPCPGTIVLDPTFGSFTLFYIR